MLRLALYIKFCYLLNSIWPQAAMPLSKRPVLRLSLKNEGLVLGLAFGLEP